MNTNISEKQAVEIAFQWEKGQLTKVTTSSPPIDYF